jgi:hypothetical protein
VGLAVVICLQDDTSRLCRCCDYVFVLSIQCCMTDHAMMGGAAV